MRVVARARLRMAIRAQLRPPILGIALARRVVEILLELIKLVEYVLIFVDWLFSF